MSKRANPTLIGIFVLSALALAIGTIAFFGYFNFFKKSEKFVLYFNESVNGLNIGSTVKFRGVPVGTVTDIRIRWNQEKESTHIPVFMEIELKRLGNRLGVELDIHDEKVYQAQINEGFRAQLQTDSIITGVLYIELDYEEYPEPPVFIQEKIIYKEIPTIPSPLAEIGQTATEIIARISSLDIKATNDEFFMLLRKINNAIDEIDFNGINEGIIDATQSVEKLAQSPKFVETANTLSDTLNQFKELSVKLENSIDPVLGKADETNREITNSLHKLQHTLSKIDTLLQPESSFRYEIENAFKKLAEAANSFKQLSETIERNPKGIITGKHNPNIKEKMKNEK